MNKRPEILIIGHDANLIQILDSIMAQSGDVIYEIRNYDQKEVEFPLKEQNEYGYYRKFIKPNKRKNIKAHK